MPALYKKYALWLLGGVVVVLILGTLVYSLFFRESSSPADSGLFPSGDGRTIVPGETGSGQDGTQSQEGDPQATLFQLHDRPIVSSVVFLRGNDPYVRSMEQGSGHVYEYDVKNRREYRVSNTSIPQIQEALWSEDGGTVAFRYEDGGIMKSAVGELSTTTAERSLLNVYFLPEGIRSLALSPDGTEVFYIVPGATAGAATGIVARRNGSSPRALFSSKLPRWFTSWPAARSILVSSPWSSQGGVSYRINPQTGAQTTIYSTSGLFIGIGGGPGGELLVTHPEHKRISLLQGGVPEPQLAFSWPSLCAFASRATSSVACATVPEAGMGVFAEWERGEHDFASNVLLADLQEGRSSLLISEEVAADRIFDVTHLALAPDASFVAFKNRIDGLLWGITIQ